MNFGEALELLKQGKLIARKGWNGKKMSLYLNKGLLPVDEDTLRKLNITVTEEDIDAECVVTHVEGISTDLFTASKGDVTVLPNIRMITPTGSIVNGWLASQSDLLSSDWEEVIWEEIR